MNEIYPSQVAPNFEKREAAQRVFEEKSCATKEFKYTSILGDYGKSIEDYIEYLISQLLLVKQAPVIMTDLGGGVGLSTLRLALKFETEIQRSKLAMIISNLRNTPDELLKERRLSAEERLYRINHAVQSGFEANYFLQYDNRLVEASEDLSNRRHLVHCISGSFSLLPTRSIVLPDGSVIPLQGNVDVIHENYSLTAWGLVPEVDILNTLRIASPFATYSAPQRDTVSFQGDLNDEDEHIKEGVAIAHQDLQNNGFSRVLNDAIRTNDDLNTPYYIFRRLKAPAINRI